MTGEIEARVQAATLADELARVRVEAKRARRAFEATFFLAAIFGTLALAGWLEWWLK